MSISHHERLTAPEVGNLWTQYMNDSMSICVLTHFIETCQDPEILKILEKARDLSKVHVESIKEFTAKEGFPTFYGFSESDVYQDVPALFTDKFMLVYMYTMALHGMNGYALAIGNTVRVDQRTYFQKCQTETMDLFDTIVNVMLAKGVFNRAPIINPPANIDFVKDESYIGGFFGTKRPVNAVEITGIYYNMVKTVVKVVLELGFSQVTQTKELRQYFERGASLCKKHMGVFEELLSENHLHSAQSLEAEITTSTTSPFSDKLMLFHIVSLVGIAVGYYGTALATCQRRDIIVQYTKLMAEVGLYAEDGLNIMIEKGWLEQTPTAADRESLAKQK
ncbi:DUF3231 family protein [Bacillus alkalicellulosilyticus]|uniref:DUF3231 family protein n=1 Tax=Alkalihalobacterium alkalicellulosilyticum TaxID=1912214 RepID=UPI001483AAF1|nr:DUF3231 family protein [Bacillus alkalicellulosilyticus]